MLCRLLTTWLLVDPLSFKWPALSAIWARVSLPLRCVENRHGRPTATPSKKITNEVQCAVSSLLGHVEFSLSSILAFDPETPTERK